MEQPGTTGFSQNPLRADCPAIATALELLDEQALRRRTLLHSEHIA
jgi:hypothetical protein